MPSHTELIKLIVDCQAVLGWTRSKPKLLLSNLCPDLLLDMLKNNKTNSLLQHEIVAISWGVTAEKMIRSWVMGPVHCDKALDGVPGAGRREGGGGQLELWMPWEDHQCATTACRLQYACLNRARWDCSGSVLSR